MRARTNVDNGIVAASLCTAEILPRLELHSRAGGRKVASPGGSPRRCGRGAGIRGKRTCRQDGSHYYPYRNHSHSHDHPCDFSSFLIGHKRAEGKGQRRTLFKSRRQQHNTVS